MTKTRGFLLSAGIATAMALTSCGGDDKSASYCYLDFFGTATCWEITGASTDTEETCKTAGGEVLSSKTTECEDVMK